MFGVSRFSDFPSLYTQYNTPYGMVQVKIKFNPQFNPFQNDKTKSDGRKKRVFCLMMGIESCGMFLSAIYTEEGEEKLHLLMVGDHIPVGAKLY